MAARKKPVRAAKQVAKPSDESIDRNAQIVRVLSILRDLDRLGGVSLYELAERYGTTTRTIRRDIEAIEQAGIPVTEDAGDGRRKRWRVAYREQERKLTDLLDASHYLALRLAMDQAGVAGRSSPLFAALEDLADKIEGALGERGKKTIRAIEGCLYSYEKFAYQNAPPDVFWKLVNAIAERRLCDVRYRAPRIDQHETAFRVLPLKLFGHAGTLYLHAFVPKHEHVIVLNLQRLLALEVLDQKGTPPDGYDPGDWEASAFGIFVGKTSVTYRLRFAAEVAPYIREKRWHPSQKLRELPGGALELTFRCSESYEVASWVASWRTSVEVLEPESLRTELAAYGRFATETYAGNEQKTKRGERRSG